MDSDTKEAVKVEDGFRHESDGTTIITADGKEYRVPVLSDADIPKIQDYLLDLRHRPMREAAGELEALKAFPDLYSEMANRLYKDLTTKKEAKRPSKAEAVVWATQDTDGITWATWFQLHKQAEHVALTLEQVWEILKKASKGNIKAMVAALADQDIAKLRAEAEKLDIKFEDATPEQIVLIARRCGVTLPNVD